MAPELEKIEVVFRIPEEAWHYIEAFGLNGWSWFDRCEFLDVLADAQVISKEHGRLIDVDNLKEQEIPAIKKDGVVYVKLSTLQDLIDNASTILEAWKGENE